MPATARARGHPGDVGSSQPPYSSAEMICAEKDLI